MKSISAATIALSLVLGSLTSAHADGRDYDRDDYRPYTQQHGDWDHRDHRDRGDRWDERQHDHDYGNRTDRDGYRAGRYDAGRYIRPHGYYHRAWRRGDKLPGAYFSNRYVVRNYRNYRLNAPPRGYHWVRVDRDVVLAAVTTGVIISVVDGFFH